MQLGFVSSLSPPVRPHISLEVWAVRGLGAHYFRNGVLSSQISRLSNWIQNILIKFRLSPRLLRWFNLRFSRPCSVHLRGGSLAVIPNKHRHEGCENKLGWHTSMWTAMFQLEIPPPTIVVIKLEGQGDKNLDYQHACAVSRLQNADDKCHNIIKSERSLCTQWSQCFVQKLYIYIYTDRRCGTCLGQKTPKWENVLRYTNDQFCL